MKLIVSAGPHTRKNSICRFILPAEQIAPIAGEKNAVKLVPAAGSALVGAVRMKGDKAELWFVLDYMGKNETVEFTVEPCCCDCAPRMHVEKTDRGLSVYNGKDFVTEYYTKDDLAKPYMGPITERYGSSITRLDFTVKEHPHHRSIWVSHGAVNGVDTWNEKAQMGYIRNKELTDLFNSPVLTSFVAHNTWTDNDGNPLCDETTEYRIFATTVGETVIDLDITLSAPYGDVTLGVTKEAGPMAVRLAESIRVDNGGTMVNAYGGVNEREIWMHRAPWMDYYGMAEGHLCGVALLDSPENEMHPTYWHSRDYGLMAGNNFFKGGERVIAKDGTKSFKYRVVAHNGDTQEANIAGRFADYAAMPIIKIAEEP